MTSDPDRAGTTGVLRITPDQLPRNHHGDPVAPLTPSGLPYQLRWVDHDHGGDLVYAETADDLLDRLAPRLPGRRPSRARRCSAPNTPSRSGTPWSRSSSSTPRTTASPSPPNRKRSCWPTSTRCPTSPRWDPPVPLVLLEGMYRPYTDRLPPLSGIDGDVQDPSNIIWLRNAHPDTYVQSLAAAGVIDLAIYNA